jgi:predicted transposase YdaD
MWKLKDIRKSRVWQEAYEEGFKQGLEEARQERRKLANEEGKLLADQRVARHLKAIGWTHKEIAQLLDVSLATALRLANR